MSEINHENIFQQEAQKQQHFRLGTVVELFDNGTAKVQFDGETEPSEKQYAYLSSYVPEKNDRVFLGKVGGTYIILGSIRHNESPIKPELPQNPEFVSVTADQGTFGEMSVAGDSSFQDIETNHAEINGILAHRGNGIGFFGAAPTTRRLVSFVTSDDQVRTRLNTLIEALGHYGLIRTS